MALLEVRNLTVGFKKDSQLLKAVNDISFSIKQGEILGLAGESGCGKSLTALSITNLLPEAAKILGGEIVFNNQVLTSLSNDELCRIMGKEISIIFQEYRQALNPVIKTGRQITETLDLANPAEKKTNKRRAVELLFRLGFDSPKKIYNTYPHQLSGGMCQRIMAAIAAIKRPRLLIADEPSSALDTESQQRILSLLMEMNRDYGMTILVISHDLSIIKQFCSRCLVMYAGRIAEECLTGDHFSPLHPYTRALVGAIPCKKKRGMDLDTIPGKVPSIEDSFAGCPFAPRCSKAQNICKESFPPPAVFGNRKVFCFFPPGDTNA